MLIRLGHCTVDLDARRVRWPDRDEGLTPSECKLLAYLASRAGEDVPRRDVMAEVWDYHPESRSHSVAVTMRRLRRKVEVDPSQPLILRTLRGFGWKLALPNTPNATAQTNLRPTRDAFFGRDEELAALEGARLSTIVGPPGIGKSRLAQEYAAHCAASGPAQQVWLLDLSHTDSENDIAAGLAQVLGVVLLRDGDWLRRASSRTFLA